MKNLFKAMNIKYGDDLGHSNDISPKTRDYKQK